MVAANPQDDGREGRPVHGGGRQTETSGCLAPEFGALTRVLPPLHQASILHLLLSAHTGFLCALFLALDREQ